MIVSLIKKAEKEITLIDGYVDVGTLNLLSKKKDNVDVTVYMLKRTKLSKTDVDNFNMQYPTLNVKYTNVFHDRFFVPSRAKPLRGGWVITSGSESKNRQWLRHFADLR